MQTYVVGVQTLAVQPAQPPPATAPKRHIYCDLAVRSPSWHALYVTHGECSCGHVQSCATKRQAENETLTARIRTALSSVKPWGKYTKAHVLCSPSFGPQTFYESYNCMLRRSGSAMRRFLDGEEAPQEYDVHLWEAAIAAPHHQVPDEFKRFGF